MRTGRDALRADCASCAGLCCVAPAFSASSDFAVGKPAGRPCHHLTADTRCAIHPALRDRGFAGCTVFDCFGAGQQVVQVTFGGRDWRDGPDVAEPMFAAFAVLRQLHELRWYLTDGLSQPAAEPVHGALRAALQHTERLAGGDATALAELDVAAHRAAVNVLLLQVGELVRTAAGGRVDHRGADLAGRKLRGADLRGANLRGAYLIGADLREARLAGADLIGVDLRGADLRGADLDGSVFLTQFQVNAARGDDTTTLPPSVRRPAHWSWS